MNTTNPKQKPETKNGYTHTLSENFTLCPKGHITDTWLGQKTTVANKKTRRIHPASSPCYEKCVCFFTMFISRLCLYNCLYLS